MVDCAICGYPAGEGRVEMVTSRAGRITLCYSCYIDVVSWVELETEEEYESEEDEGEEEE